MKKHSFLRLFSALAATVLIAGLTDSALAGPEPKTFAPVKSEKAAAKLKVGSEIAISCGNCNGITVLTVDRERSYLRGFQCPHCKKTFTRTAPGGGGRFAYTDGTGYTSYLTGH